MRQELNMHIDDIQQLSTWLAATNIDLLELNGPDEHLCLRREGTRIQIIPRHTMQDEPAPRTVAAAASVGMFLHGHPLRGEPLAQPGTSVRAGQTVGLLRIGALLLPVTASHDSIVAGVLVESGTIVGYGTPLVELQLLEKRT